MKKYGDRLRILKKGRGDDPEINKVKLDRDEIESRKEAIEAMRGNFYN